MAVFRIGTVVPALAMLLAACAITSPIPPPPVARQLEADTRITLSGGATFTASKSWFVTTRDRLVVLEDPDRTLTVTLVERDEPAAVAAIEAAWKQAHPAFARRVRRTARPLPDPWDEFVRLEYQTTTAEARSVVGTARRSGTTWYVTLLVVREPPSIAAARSSTRC